MANLIHSENMSSDFLQNLRSYHPAWKLLAATRAPRIISFLHAAFVADNSREIPEYILVGKLNQHLETLNVLGQDVTNAKDLLTQWAGDDFGWLRKFYPLGNDEVHYDLTSAAQKAIEWVETLNAQSFIGTESRLLMVFQLFHEIIEQSDEDPQRRIAELERRKAEIDEEIDRALMGYVKVLDSVQIKERYLQAMQLSREILADFRAVEQNFRELRRTMQEKITVWDKGKGALIGDFFHNQEGIAQSEQGRSFRAFFDFLMSTAAQDDFEQTIRDVGALDAVSNLPGSKNAYRIINDWVDGSKHVQNTLALVSEQLRRYVDENFLQEERRINQIINSVLTSAISLAENAPQGNFMQINALSPEIVLPFDRPLFTPPVQIQINKMELDYGNYQDEDDSALYSHISVDKELLSNQIESLLHGKAEVSLAEVIEVYPIKLGLAELIGYLSLAQSFGATLQTQVSEPVFWNDADGNIHKADFCRIVYRRRPKEQEYDG